MCMKLYKYLDIRRGVPVGVPLDLVMEWHELPNYHGIHFSQLIYLNICYEILHRGRDQQKTVPGHIARLRRLVFALVFRIMT